MDETSTYTAFAGNRLLAGGPLDEVLRKIKRFVDRRQAQGKPAEQNVLIFCDLTGKQVDFDMRGTEEDVLLRAAPKPLRAGPGRPRLGVVSREISLLPRHWEWLEEQEGGASASLRRLVDEARKTKSPDAEVRARIDATGRVMTVLAGNSPNFEEACRALYRRDFARLAGLIDRWPRDIRAYIHAGVSNDQRHGSSDTPPKS